MKRFSIPALFLAAAALVVAHPAHAHEAHAVGGGLVNGLLHPLTGLDHLVAMVAVGLWGAQLGRPLIYALPVAFPMMMAVGGLLGLADVPMPAVEIGIAGSALLLGVAVLLALRLPAVVAVAVVAIFALFHGYAHGQELPHAASPIAYGAGFMISTVLSSEAKSAAVTTPSPDFWIVIVLGPSHAVGILVGLLTLWKPAGPVMVRASGGGVALVGSWFLAGALGLI